MMRFVKFLAISSFLIVHSKVHGRPQFEDIPGAAIMAFGQAKDLFDNGAAASDKKEFEFFGAKIKNDMSVGFGDAIRSKRNTHDSKELNGLRRAKRLSNIKDFSKQISNSKEKFISKRAIDDSYEYDYSSSESEDSERRKRSPGIDQFVEQLFLLKK